MKNKLKHIIVTITILLTFYTIPKCDETKAIKLLSLEGQEVSVSIMDSSLHDKAVIQLNDSVTICLNGSRGLIDDVSVINQKFIEVKYRIMGGSGVGIQKYTLICVSKGQMYRAIDLEYLFESDYSDGNETGDSAIFDEHSLHELNFNYFSNSDSLKARIIEHRNEQSKIEPRNNKNLWDTLYLNFDSLNFIFYSGFDSLGGNYTLTCDGPENDSTIYIPQDLYPVIHLRYGGVYYFINKKWLCFIKNGTDIQLQLLYYSSKCD
jgi:hypothetical protein